MGVKVRWYDGAWYVLIDHKGRRKAKKFGTDAAAKRRAEEAARLLAARLTLGDLGLLENPPQAPTLADFCELWLGGEYLRRRLRPNTALKYAEVMRKHWLPQLGHLDLPALSRAQIREAIHTFFQQGLATSTVRWFLNVLQSCLSAAIEEGYLTHNPAARSTQWLLRAAMTRRVESTQTIFSAAEIEQLLQRARQRSPMTYVMVLTLLRTGLRISELLGLQVSDLDFARREIAVRRTWGNTSRGPQYYGLPKSGQQRLVDMSTQLCETLQQWLASLPSKSLWLFPSSRGRPMTPNTFYMRHWWPLFVDGPMPTAMRRVPSGGTIPYRPPHVARHSFATHLLWQNESPVYVKEQLGHSSIRVTVDVYGTTTRRDNKQAVDRLDSLHPQARRK